MRSFPNITERQKFKTANFIIDRFDLSNILEDATRSHMSSQLSISKTFHPISGDRVKLGPQMWGSSSLDTKEHCQVEILVTFRMTLNGKSEWTSQTTAVYRLFIPSQPPLRYRSTAGDDSQNNNS